MLVIGAGGFAKQLTDVLRQVGERDLAFYDDTDGAPPVFCEMYPVITTRDEAVQYLEHHDRRFVLGVGDPMVRKQMAEKFAQWGGDLRSVVSPHAHISDLKCRFGAGINILTAAVVENNVSLAEGVLVNIGAVITHDCIVGAYTEIAPRVTVAGGCSIGELCRIGTGAVFIPGVKVGNRATIAAGAVVTENIPDDVMAAGVPARIRKRKDV
jgi:sugar O-acyltransferase (sialic acid O-acetyltransferase NeuD family)